MAWVQASGKGTLHTFAVVERAPTPAFADHVPYVPALVDLEEGPPIPDQLVGVDPHSEEIVIGMAVEVVFEDVTADVTLPKFRPPAKGFASKRRRVPVAWTANIRPS